MPDEIIQELWQIKDSMAQECEYDIDRLVAQIQTRQGKADQSPVDRRAMREAGEAPVSAKPARKPLEATG